MRIVLDTNVLVSGLLSPFQAPGEIVRMTSAGALHLCYDGRILLEYRAVLARAKFQFEPEPVRILLDQITARGVLVSSIPLRKSLPDPSDEIFLEAACAGNAACVVTGNLKHFPTALRQGTLVLNPRDFLEFFRSR